MTEILTERERKREYMRQRRLDPAYLARQAVEERLRKARGGQALRDRQNAQARARRAVGRPSFSETFFARVDASGDCWEWTGHLSPDGYGTVSRGNRPTGAHRVAYELLVGPIERGLHIDHLCRNRRCVNPDHLEPVTPRENVLRGFGYVAQRRRTRCRNGHDYTPTNTRTTARGTRICMTCHRAGDAAYRSRRAA